MTLLELNNIISKYLLIADKGFVKLLLAIHSTSQMDIPAPFLVIVGASSGGKSTLLEALSAYVPEKGNRVYWEVDRLTPRTFLSGVKSSDGTEASLLMRMQDKSVLVIKDLANLASKNSQERGEIIGQLRQIYDRKMDGMWGNGKTIAWKKKLSMIAGSTTAIYSMLEDFSDLGERFVLYHLEMPDRLEATRKALKEINDYEASSAMKKAFNEYLQDLPCNDTYDPDNDTFENIVQLSDMTTLARSKVKRDQYSREKKILTIEDAEMPMRFGKVLMGLAKGFMNVNMKEIGQPILLDEDKETIYQVALSSVHKIKRQTLKFLAKNNLGVDIKTTSNFLGVDYDSARIHLDDLVALKLVERQYAILGGADKAKYTLKPRFIILMEKFDHVKAENLEAVDKPIDSLPEIGSTPTDKGVKIEELINQPLALGGENNDF